MTASPVVASSGPDSGPATIPHSPALDGLRALAVGLVVWYHAPYVFPAQALDGSAWIDARAGWVGVDLFFVISGYLITRILLETRANPVQLRMFWARRALRILPLALVYLSILQAIAVDDPLQLGIDGVSSWWMYWLYLANVHIALNSWQPLVLMILWSLAVEEQFYLFWPFSVRYLRRRTLLGLCLAIMVLAPVARLFVVANAGYPAVYVLTVGRIDTLAAGAILAVLLTNPKTRERTLRYCRRLAPVGVLVVVLVLYNQMGLSHLPNWFTFLGFSGIACAFAAIVGTVLDPPPWLGALLELRSLRFVGKISYGIYVWHCLVGGALANLLDRLSISFGFAAAFGLWVLSTLLVAALSWYVLERPLLRLKRYFPQRVVSDGP